MSGTVPLVEYAHGMAYLGQSMKNMAREPRGVRALSLEYESSPEQRCEQHELAAEGGHESQGEQCAVHHVGSPSCVM